ncbi:MAG TPA: PQQ-dependent dehydrogenase, methanol/ethanol family [Novosphingobium sp.]|nr:PQQ-dependent dehydrogenase, methanol/ethanol family [Novosphingobium sp.]
MTICRMTLRAALAMCALAPLVSGCNSGADDAAAFYLDGNDGKNWPGYGNTFGEQHYSPLAQIDGKSVGGLALEWFYDLGGENSATQPIAVNGVVYFGLGHSIVHAIDARTGKLLWRHDPHAAEQAGKNLRLGWGSRGIAWWDGKIYTGTQDGRLIALDAETGNELWSVQTFPKDQAAYISGAPRVFNGKVIVGFGSDMGKVRGYVTAYDANTGARKWRFYTVPGNPADGFENKAMEMAARTWHGKWWENGGGGTVWNAISYDPETDTVFIGTGNGYPWNHKKRSEGKGDNLFLASTVALDGETGAYKWHYQQNPGDTWDYNSAMDMPLADLTIDGKARKVIMTAPKNGFYYVIDRTNGKLVSAKPIVKVNWASGIDLKTGRPIENPEARFPDGKQFHMWPASTGAHSWPPMAFSPRTGLAYIPAIRLGMMIADSPDLATWKAPQDRVSGGTTAVNYPPPGADDPDQMTGELMAWDPVAQKKVWGVRQPTPSNGGVMATGGNLVFQGTVDGTFKAYDAKTGKVMWSFDAGTPIIAPPISYEVDGKQYVTVLTGLGTTMGIWGPILEKFNVDPRSQKRRVLTFSLTGKAKLPKAEQPTLAFADVTGFRADPAKVAAGMGLYYAHCMVCHGIAAVSATHAPDLRRSAVPGSPEAFASVVRDGIAASTGMPGFGEFTDDQLEALRQFIGSETAKARAGAKAALPKEVHGP